MSAPPTVPIPACDPGWGEIARAVRRRQLLQDQLRLALSTLKQLGWSPYWIAWGRDLLQGGLTVRDAIRIREQIERDRDAIWNTSEWRAALAEGMRLKTFEEQQEYDAKQRLKRKARQLEGGSRRRARLKGATIEPVNRLGIIERDERTCYLCGRQDLADDEIHLDHVMPLSRGGAHSEANLRVACEECNIAKGARTADEYLGGHRPDVLGS